MAGCYPQTMPAVFLSPIGLTETGKFLRFHAFTLFYFMQGEKLNMILFPIVFRVKTP